MIQTVGFQSAFTVMDLMDIILKKNPPMKEVICDGFRNDHA